MLQRRARHGKGRHASTIRCPLGAGIDWSIASAAGELLDPGAARAETLHCTAVDLAAGASFSVHVTSRHELASCKEYANKASASATNHATLKASDSTTVECPDLKIEKTADDGTVDAGEDDRVHDHRLQRTGRARRMDVTLDDPLPANGGLNWSIDGGNGAANC